MPRIAAAARATRKSGSFRCFQTTPIRRGARSTAALKSTFQNSRASGLRAQQRADLALREVAGATKLVGSAGNAHGHEFADWRIEMRAPGRRHGRRLRLCIAPLPPTLDERPVEAVERADRHRLRRVQGCGTLLESRPLDTADGSHGWTEIDAHAVPRDASGMPLCYAASLARSATRRQKALVEVAFDVAGVAVDSSARLAASSPRNCWLTLTRAISLSIVPRSRSTAASLSSIASSRPVPGAA